MSEQELSFEQSLTQLEEIVTEMEKGELSLDELLARFERGIGLLRVCEGKLADAEARIEVLTRAQIDSAATAPKAAPAPAPMPPMPEESAADADVAAAFEDIPLPDEAPPDESLF